MVNRMVIGFEIVSTVSACEALHQKPIRSYSIGALFHRQTKNDGPSSDYIADILSLKATEQEILIYNPELERVAQHPRQLAGAGKRVENPDHFKTKKIRYGLEPVREAFLELGEMADLFLKGLTERFWRAERRSNIIIGEWSVIWQD